MSRAASALSPLALALAFAMAGPALAHPDEVAVLAGPTKEDIALAPRFRAALAEASLRVLDPEMQNTRFGDLARVPPSSLDTARVLADIEVGRLEPRAAVTALDDAIGRLEAARELDEEGYALLERSRVEAARQLTGLAGPGELGGGESELGRRVVGLLLDALRANPNLDLDPARFPPKLRRLLAEARRQQGQARRGTLHVRSTPSGATVLLEGQPVGRTPLSLENALVEGRYRLQLEDAEGRRSRTRVVVIGVEPAHADVDWRLEQALRVEDGEVLLPSALDASRVEEVRRRLDVGALVRLERSDSALTARVHRAAGDESVEVPRDGANPLSDETLAALALAVRAQLSEGRARTAPAQAAAVDEAEPDVLWMAGAGASAVVVLGVVAGAVGLSALWWRDGVEQQRAMRVEVVR